MPRSVMPFKAMCRVVHLHVRSMHATTTCINHASSLQEKCTAAGLDYEEVLQKTAVWQPSASSTDAAAAATVKDGEAAKSAGGCDVLY